MSLNGEGEGVQKGGVARLDSSSSFRELPGSRGVSSNPAAALLKLSIEALVSSLRLVGGNIPSLMGNLLTISGRPSSFSGAVLDPSDSSTASQLSMKPCRMLLLLPGRADIVLLESSIRPRASVRLKVRRRRGPRPVSPLAIDSLPLLLSCILSNTPAPGCIWPSSISVWSLLDDDPPLASELLKRLAALDSR